MDSARELPDGRLVCGPHGFVICGKCCVDYSFMDDVLGRDEEEEDDDDEEVNHVNVYSFLFRNSEEMVMMGRPMQRGVGQVFPTKFVPPNDSAKPMEVFTGRRLIGDLDRHTLPNDPRTIVIHTDGACLNNGQANPKAGWAFSHGLDPAGGLVIHAGRLEKKGPFGHDALQTSNRAELRAVIAALRFRHWPDAGVHRLVIATDSEYAVEGSTKWAKKWVGDGWTKPIFGRGRGERRREEVKNRDLWEALLGEVEVNKDLGMAVEFWRIPREWNDDVDAAAKQAAGAEHAPNVWTEPNGVMLGSLFS